VTFSFTVTFGDVLMLGTMLASAWKINRAWTRIIVEHTLLWRDYCALHKLRTRSDDEEV
jgi:hypothetical protein